MRQMHCSTWTTLTSEAIIHQQVKQSVLFHALPSTPHIWEHLFKAVTSTRLLHIVFITLHFTSVDRANFPVSISASHSSKPGTTQYFFKLSKELRMFQLPRLPTVVWEVYQHFIFQMQKSLSFAHMNETIPQHYVPRGHELQNFNAAQQQKRPTSTSHSSHLLMLKTCNYFLYFFEPDSFSLSTGPQFFCFNFQNIVFVQTFRAYSLSLQSSRSTASQLISWSWNLFSRYSFVIL